MLWFFPSCQAAINDIDTILGTAEENLKQISNGRTPQLKAPRPKELQKILQEHQKGFHNTKVLTNAEKVNTSFTEQSGDNGENEEWVLSTEKKKIVQNGWTIHHVWLLCNQTGGECWETC